MMNMIKLLMAEQNKKIIYLLIGPKGSGKTFIGSLMDKHFDIRFIRVDSGKNEVG